MNDSKKFENEKQSIQEKFNKILEEGFCDDFIQYYEKHFEDERYKIDYKNFEVMGVTDSTNITPALNQYVDNGKISLILGYGRIDFVFFLENTTKKVPSDRKWKWGGYFYVYRYLLQFVSLTFEELLYLFEMSLDKKGAFFFLGMGGNKEFLEILNLNKNINIDVKESFTAYLMLNNFDINSAYKVFKKE
jgi:hypothetical protein